MKKVDDLMVFLNELQKMNPGEKKIAEQYEAVNRLVKDPKNKELLGHYIIALEKRKAAEIEKKGFLEEARQTEKGLGEGIVQPAGKDAVMTTAAVEADTEKDKKAAILRRPAPTGIDPGVGAHALLMQEKKAPPLLHAVLAAQNVADNGIAMAKTMGLYLAATAAQAGLIATSPVIMLLNVVLREVVWVTSYV